MNRTKMKLGRDSLLKLIVVTGLLLAFVSSVSWAEDTTTYYVRIDDTFNSVADAHGLTIEELLAINPDITDPNEIYVGTPIQIPAPEVEEIDPGSAQAECPRSYTVAASDTWNTIATAHDINPGILALVNNMVVTDELVIGFSLCIPVVEDDGDEVDSDTDDAPQKADDTPQKAAPPTTLPKPGEGKGVYHTVVRGEYLSLIARQYDCTARTLVAVNNVANPSLVYVNTRLWVPENCASLQHLLPAISLPRPTPAPRPALVTPTPQSAPTAPQPGTAAPTPQPAPAAPQPGTAAPTPQPAPAAPQPGTAAPRPAPPVPARTYFNYNSQGPWTGRYYINPNVQGGPAVTRQDAQIAFDWGTGSPAGSVPADGFSVQWTGNFFFTGGEYHFIALADDGIRIWVDDALIINGWKDQSQTLYYTDYTPRYGNHTVRVEYYDARLDATAIVNWAPTR